MLDDTIGMALKKYEKRIVLKRLSSWLFTGHHLHKHPAINKLRSLSDTNNQSTVFKICLEAYQYFLYDPPCESHLSFNVYKAVLAWLSIALCPFDPSMFKKLSCDGVIQLRDNVDTILKEGKSSFEKVISAMIALDGERLLTQEHIDAINAHTRPTDLADALKILFSNSLSKSDDKEAIIKHAHPKALASALFNFDHHFISFLSQKYRECVIKSDEPIELLDVLKILHATHLLKSENVNAILKNDCTRLCIRNALREFQKVGFLSGQKNQSNFDRLLHPDNHIFLRENFIWQRIPNNLWTPTLMNELMSLAQQENPKEQMQHYVDEFLIEKKFERDAFLAEKEFQPDFRFYINDLRNRKPSYAQRFQQFGLVAEQEFLCPISHGIINIPVFIQNQRVRHSYDFIYLVRAIQLHGKDPITRKPITLADIKPDKKLCDLMEKKIMEKKINEAEEKIKIQEGIASFSSLGKQYRVYFFGLDLALQETSGEVCVSKEELLAQENIHAINAHECPQSLADAFKILYSSRRFVPATLEDRHAVINHSNPEKLAWALSHFNRSDYAKFLKETHRELVIKSNDPMLIINLLRLLHSTDLMSDENVNAVLKDEQILLYVANALNKFKKAGLLSGQERQSNFERLLHPDNRIFCEAFFLWDQISDNLLTQNSLNELIKRAKEENPEEKMQKYIDSLAEKESINDTHKENIKTTTSTRSYLSLFRSVLEVNDLPRETNRKNHA